MVVWLNSIEPDLQFPHCHATTRSEPERPAPILHCESDSGMELQSQSPLRVGQVLDITFPPFTPRITVHSEHELTVEIIAGDNLGFSDTVAYEAVTVRDRLVVLSWQEHIGSTIVHVLDFASGEAYTAVTPAKGEFMRLRGRMRVRSTT